MNLFSELNQFRTAADKLGRVIKDQKHLWKDQKYESLSADVAIIGNQARRVIIAGHRAANAMKEFDRILYS